MHKRILLSVGLLGLWLGSAGNSLGGAYVDRTHYTDQVDIAEIVLRNEYPLVKHVKNGECYLAFGYNQDERRWNDPPDELLERLADLKLKLLKASAAPARQTEGKTIPIFSVAFKEWIGDDEAVVEVSRRGGLLNADGFTIRLKRTDGKWHVTTRTNYWTS